jgi:predicted RNA-binding protein YlxR (DUF448 family)
MDRSVGPIWRHFTTIIIGGSSKNICKALWSAATRRRFSKALTSQRTPKLVHVYPAALAWSSHYSLPDPNYSRIANRRDKSSDSVCNGRALWSAATRRRFSKALTSQRTPKLVRVYPAALAWSSHYSLPDPNYSRIANSRAKSSDSVCNGRALWSAATRRRFSKALTSQRTPKFMPESVAAPLVLSSSDSRPDPQSHAHCDSRRQTPDPFERTNSPCDRSVAAKCRSLP